MTHDNISFVCPGCNDTHTFDKRWTFNGDMECPTISPSLLVTSGHYCERARDRGCWCTYNAENPMEPAPFECYRCHSFIRNGYIEFLNDSTHKLAGQTVPVTFRKSEANV